MNRAMSRLWLRTSYGLAGLLFVLAACRPATLAILSEEDVAAITRLHQRWRESILAHDWATLASSYEASAVLMPPNETTVTGPQAISDWFAGTGLEIAAFTIASATIEGVGHVAHSRGAYTLTVTLPGGTDSMTDRGKYLWIVRRGPDGTWRIAVEIWNSDLPVGGPPSSQ